MLKNDLVKGAKGAGEYLGLDPRAVYNLVENGSLPCVRMGRILFFRKSELDDVFSSQAAA